MSAVADLNIKRLEGVAIWMAPALRDKFDFSDDGDYDKLAEMSYKAAKAMCAHSDALQAAAVAKDAVEAGKVLREAEEKRLREQQADAATVTPFPGGAK